MYLHNGFIKNYCTHCRSLLEARLDPEFGASIQGNTDSECLFALFRQLLAEEPDLPLEAVLEGLFEQLEEWAGQQEALLNIVITDGQRLYAARHAFNHDCPSLYYITDDESFPGAQLIASEPLTQADFWQPVPEHHILILDPEQPPELIPL
ncbi:MAG: class II glutamine amidotransferase, partial [Gammaproteobacteria bacterium]